MAMIRERVRYVGRVQGVGFRATAREVARGHMVTGWVRNEADGSVLLEVQGEASAVAAFRAEVSRVTARLIASETAMSAGVETGEREFRIAR
jgi:acylphosphatase